MKRKLNAVMVMLLLGAMLLQGSVASAAGITNGNANAGGERGRCYKLNAKAKKTLGKKKAKKVASVVVKVKIAKKSKDLAGCMIVDEKVKGKGYIRDYLVDSFKSVYKDVSVKAFSGKTATIKMKVNFKKHQYQVECIPGCEAKVTSVKYYDKKGKRLKK